MDGQNNPKVVYSDNDIIDIAPDVVAQITGQQLIDNHITNEEKSNVATVTQSPNFKSGVSGWRLNSNGIIEATGVQIAGNITISGGEIIAVSSGGTGVGTLTGIVKGNGTSAFSAISPLSGTKVYYVADSSGGAVTRKLTFTDGVLTSET